MEEITYDNNDDQIITLHVMDDYDDQIIMTREIRDYDDDDQIMMTSEISDDDDDDDDQIMTSEISDDDEQFMTSKICDDDDDDGDEIRTSILSLPYDCLSEILSFTTPKDAIRASAVSSEFKLCSDRDTTWQRFLPSNYERILSFSETPLIPSTKKELFFHLCDSPIFLDNRTKCFWLSKSSGKNCYMLCARVLSISKKNSRRNWKWPLEFVHKSRFPQVAELISIKMLRIKCRIRTRILSPRTNYAFYLVFKTTKNCHGLDTEFKGSVRFAGRSDGMNAININEYNICSVYFTTPKLGSSSSSSSSISRGYPDHEDEKRRKIWRKEMNFSYFPNKRKDNDDGWMEVFLGEFLFLGNNDGDGDGEIEIQLYEKPKVGLKSGLIIEGIEIRPFFS